MAGKTPFDAACLADVVRLGLVPRDVFVMDEFTHDIVVPFEGKFLVYDTT